MSIVSLGDQELVKLYVNGNEKAFELLITRHKDRVYRFILSKIKDPELANDYFQDTFMKVIVTLKGGSYNEEGKFLPWVLRIAHNLIIDGFRKNKKVRFLSETRSASEDYSVFSRLSNDDLNVLQITCKEELETQVVRFLDELPVAQKEIIYQRLYQDLSFKEIAEMEDISINTALGRMRYALINLRKLMDQHQVVTEI
ncbi:MAG: sigma-70 family RNA polymerase sigma factor [Crocinitomicaceae bacterium]|nr:sigma-70 family RNA polymerase sigma factor [Crocinitomicaceae bacterium]